MYKTKKNWALRAMILTLAFTLISTCLLGGTLAKYVTVGSGSDTARVAIWGVTIDTDNVDLFSDSYEADDSGYYYAVSTESVVSLGGDNVVAPGTFGTAGTFSISGTPEVASQITFKVDSDNSGYYVGSTKGTWPEFGGSGSYEPIKWSITSSDITLDEGTFSELMSALSTFSIDCEPGADLSAVLSSTPIEISWKWDYEGGDTNNKNDTYLGDNVDANNYNIKLKFDIVVTQID